MKYKNITDKVKYLKINNEWLSITPSQVFNLEMNIVEEGFKLIEEVKEKKLVKKVDKVVEVDNVEVSKYKTEEELKKMKKDQLNDYAAKIGFSEEINTSLKKSKMIEVILKLQSK